ncbi:hypothetical protein HG536_0H03880 [Torulaspora globosa]|uniref:Matrin-type domain-containing protein n=1 Tax=Torulaspora globosa TaxID=48254 RepID=A0A7G3ZNC6_9SACH|nr:uncharacterized protein HG536_0H03880 [Torulaspora globosa]QLL35012.1 hypothetical protein HG536_0H03880 [Torulaspora globosa]
MARYYCEYCHSYLTHDTLSVRKSHVIGKNHLRIVGNYYRNKAKQEETERVQPRKRQNRNPKTTKNAGIKQPIHCPTNREKRRLNRIARYHRKELQTVGEESLLQKVYDGSPGYSKIFIDGNRLDIGDLVRTSRLPQRANASEPQNNAPTRTRNEVFTPSRQSFTLEPPRILTQWQSTVPKQSLYHEERLLNTVIDESRKRMQTPVISHARKRKN